jgi:cytoskeletal protein CcmA (bactofilin family)
MSNEEFSADFEPRVMQFDGLAKIPAGKILQDIKISGFGRIDGDFECDGLHTEGLLRSKGNLVIHGDFKCEGAFTCKGKLKCDQDVHIEGATSFREGVYVKGALHIEGAFKCRDNIRAIKSALFAGSTKVKGDLSSHGTIKIFGRGRIYGNVVGENVIIEKSDKVKLPFSRRSLITGDIAVKGNITIDNIKVIGEIQGRNVHIGENSEIQGNVFYVDEIDISSGALLMHEPVKISADQLPK